VLFEPVRVGKVYAIVIDQVRHLIDSGTLVPGDRLPPERELCKMLGVSRASVRQAISAMEAMNMVEIRQGDGTYVARANESRDVFRAFSEFLSKELISPIEIVEARMSLEPLLARLCAERATRGQIEDIKHAMQVERSQNEKRRILFGYNADFHLRIADGSQNRVLSLLTKTVFQIMKTNMARQMERYSTEADAKADLHLKQHVRIFDAIARRNGPAAEKRMAEHIDTVQQEAREDFVEHGESSKG
jgi:GntR family transcriptional repressor for pyruvate dehydrogenase complex